MLISPFNKPEKRPPAGHPRLMLTARDLPRVRANFKKPENALAVRVFDRLLARPVTGEGATPEYGAYDLGRYLAAEARALRALLSGSAADAREAADCLFILLRSFTVHGGNMGARWGGHLIFISSEVYDWCGHILTAAEKEEIVARCERIAADTFEMGYPPAKQAPISGHGAEAQLLRDLLAFGIAVYDERPDVYDWCAGRLLDEYAPQYREYLASGVHPQGPSYGAYRWTCLCWSELLFRAMGHTVFGNMESTAEWLFYMTRPDGEALRLGDDFYETKDDNTRSHPFAVPFFLSSALTGRTDLRALAYEGMTDEYLDPSHRGMDYYDGGSFGEGLISPAAVLIFDGMTAPKDSASVPPCRHFGFPVGLTVYKKGPLLVMAKTGELWNANHDHLDMGCFQIYYGKALLTDSGVYDSYHTPHRRHYLIHTCAHNCLTVERPDRAFFGEWKPDAAYDGSMRRPCGAVEPLRMEQWKELYRMGTVTEHRESDGGFLLVSDLTEAYRHTCSRMIRTAELIADPARLAPDEAARLTVTDEVQTTDPEFTVKFNLHCQEEPVVENDRVFTVTNGGYAVRCRVLSPENVRTEALGGPGREFISDGNNYPPAGLFSAEYGWGRVVVTCAEKTRAHRIRVEFSIKKA